MLKMKNKVTLNPVLELCIRSETINTKDSSVSLHVHMHLDSIHQTLLKIDTRLYFNDDLANMLSKYLACIVLSTVSTP